MLCENCGNVIKEGEKFCGKCGKSIEQGEVKNNVSNERNTESNQGAPLIRLVLYIVAIIVIIMFFNGAGTIAEASDKMLTLRSVSGETVAEAYYQYYGRFLEGLAIVIRGLGITCGIIIGYIGRKFK